MVALTQLWLPIVLSAVLVFVAAALIWVVLPNHKKDWSSLPRQDDLMRALREAGVGIGMYVFPFTDDPKERAGDDFRRKCLEGPAGYLIVFPGEMYTNMAPQLVKSFVYYLVVGLLVAYVGAAALPVGTDYLKVFQVCGTTAILAHSAAIVPKGIFWGWSWRVVWTEVFDGVVYGLLTAGVFAWLWPG